MKIALAIVIAIIFWSVVILLFPLIWCYIEWLFEKGEDLKDALRKRREKRRTENGK